MEKNFNIGCGPLGGFGKFLKRFIVVIFLRTVPGELATTFAAPSKS